MAQQDFYAVLGVPSGATADEIKKQYRRLAKQFHPDTNKDDAKAADRFKEISEAYTVLGDAEQRKQYDEMRRLGAYDPFAARARPRGPRMEDVDVGNLGGFGDLFGTIFGNARQQRPMGPEQGQSVETTLEVPFKVAALGGKLPITLDLSAAGANRTRKKVLITVPAGTESGSKIRLKGQGGPGVRGGPNGDLLITVHVKPDPDYERDGLDVIQRYRINLAQATLGSKVNVQTLDDKTITLTLPAGTPSGKRFRVRGQGIEKDGQRGDLLVEIQLAVPESLTAEQRKLMEQFATAAGLAY
jgi:DnaJ-class molecular chaperone